MKKIILLLVIVLATLSCSEKEKGNVHITGEIKGLSQGKLYIQRLKDTVLKPIKLIRFDGNSAFETSINIDEPEVLFLYLDRGVSNSLDNNIAFFAEKGKMTIYSEVDNFISKARITGSKNQELWDEYKKVMANYSRKNLEYIEQKLIAGYNNETQKVDSLQRLEDNILKKKYLYAVNFCLNNSDYEIAPYIALSDIFDINTRYLDTVHNSLTEPVRNSKYGKLLTQYLADIKRQQEKEVLGVENQNPGIE